MFIPNIAMPCLTVLLSKVDMRRPSGRVVLEEMITAPMIIPKKPGNTTQGASLHYGNNADRSARKA